MRFLAVRVYFTLLFIWSCAGLMLGQSAKPLDLQFEPLPQEPKASKQVTDTVDEGLRGKVKLLIQERSEISKSGSVQPKQLSYLALFDEGGNFVQRDYYDYMGNPYRISAYGYIDGKRVSQSRSIVYDYDPPAAAAPPGAAKENMLRDVRYEYSYEYSYVNNKLVEKKLISNSGKLLSRDVYIRRDELIEEFTFDRENTLNQRRLKRIDSKGNVIEEIFFGLSNRDIYGDKVYRYKYTFDSQGNWTKKEAMVEVIEKGAVSFQPAYIQFRTFEYY